MMPIIAAQVQPAPLACNLRALDAGERKRHAGLSSKLLTSVSGREETNGGHRFLFDAAQRISFPEIAEWVGMERKCCPFLRFQLTLEESGAVSLAMSGRAGVKRFLEVEFRLKP